VRGRRLPPELTGETFQQFLSSLPSRPPAATPGCPLLAPEREAKGVGGVRRRVGGDGTAPRRRTEGTVVVVVVVVVVADTNL